MSRREIFILPEYAFPNRLAEVRRIKKWAAKAGRTYRDRDKHFKARKKLREALEPLDIRALLYWSYVVMIDDRWCGATGQGGFWAVASRCVNEEAKAIILGREK